MTKIICPVKLLREDGTVLSPINLVQNSLVSQNLDFIIENSYDKQKKSFSFTPNRELFGENLPMHGTSSDDRLCHFVGDSSYGMNALSTCTESSITGLLYINNHHYVLEVKGHNFFLHPQVLETCAWISRDKRSLMTIPEYYQDYVDHRTRHVELVYVADSSMYKKYGKNETKVHDRLHSIANIVNAVYSPLNIKVTLVYALIWKDGDPIEITQKSDQTLIEFLTFRKGLMEIHNHDNAQLITDTEFFDLVIGKAYKGTMCSFMYSGGIISDHSTNAAAVASTSAHEMGHSFGMEHDPKDCKCPEPLCIMSASNGGYANLTYFSDCSLNYLKHSFERKMDYCLFNVPKKVFGGAKCGNGIVEEGEECDCGNRNVCPNKCCVASKCKLAKDAFCATGDCCDLETCKPKPKAYLCREQIGVCDLPEFCDGETGDCPADFFVQNGQQCPTKKKSGFCYEGECGDRLEQCKMLYGDDSSVNDNCYHINLRGDTYGNCGTDKNKATKACSREDQLCGKVYCSSDLKTSIFGDASTVNSIYYDYTLRNGTRTKCRTIHTSTRGGKLNSDPSYARDGATCGSNKMCLNSKCSNVSSVLEVAPQCDPKGCNNHGICNNVGNCHCEYGYGGVSCDIPGYGGSVNSGPATDQGFNPLLWFGILMGIILIIFGLATYFYKRKTNKWLPATMWRSFRRCAGIYGMNVPTRKAPPPPKRAQQTNDFTSAWGDPEPVIRVGHQPILPPLQSHFQPSIPDVQFNSLTPVDNLIDSPSPPAINMKSNRSDHRYNPLPAFAPESNALNQDSSSSDEYSSGPPPVPPHQNVIVRPTTKPPPPLKPKPKLPLKPPVANKPVTNVNVKDLAAKFDVKNSNVDIL